MASGLQNANITLLGNPRDRGCFEKGSIGNDLEVLGAKQPRFYFNLTLIARVEAGGFDFEDEPHCFHPYLYFLIFPQTALFGY
jgi:hypothetical protein